MRKLTQKHNLAFIVIGALFGSLFAYFRKLKLKLSGVKYNKVTIYGPIDIRHFDESIITLSEAKFRSQCQLWARGNGVITIGKKLVVSSNRLAFLCNRYSNDCLVWA
jgi:hypothetical protein